MHGVPVLALTSLSHSIHGVPVLSDIIHHESHLKWYLKAFSTLKEVIKPQKFQIKIKITSRLVIVTNFKHHSSNSDILSMNIFNQTSLTPPDRSWHSHSMVYSISLDGSRHFLQFYDNDIVANLNCSQFYVWYFILHAVTIVLLLLLLRLNIIVYPFGGYSTLCSIPHMQIICTFLCLGMSLFLKVRCRFDF